MHWIVCFHTLKWAIVCTWWPFCKSSLSTLTTVNAYSPRASACLPPSSRNPVKFCLYEEEFQNTFLKQIWGTRRKKKGLQVFSFLRDRALRDSNSSHYLPVHLFIVFFCALKHHGWNSHASHYHPVFFASFWAVKERHMVWTVGRKGV